MIAQGQRRMTDDLISHAYDTAARMDHIGNILSHLMLLSSSVEASCLEGVIGSCPPTAGGSETTDSHTDSPPGLAGESPWSEGSRQTLCSLPVAPGQVFGPAPPL